MIECESRMKFLEYNGMSRRRVKNPLFSFKTKVVISLFVIITLGYIALILYNNYCFENVVKKISEPDTNIKQETESYRQFRYGCEKPIKDKSLDRKIL